METLIHLEEWIVVAVSLDVVAFRSHFLAKHLEAVVARFVHFARLALGAEVAVAGC